VSLTAVGRYEALRVAAARAVVALGLGAERSPRASTSSIAGNGAAARLRLLWCIMNDGAYGAEIHELRADGVDDRGSAFGRADLAAIAKGFGLRGANVTEIGQIGALFDVRRRTRPRCGTSTCPTRWSRRARGAAPAGGTARC